MEIILSNNVGEIESLVSQGFCPVECSIGGESITDVLQMDHHGQLSHLESVALRAYRDHFGVRAEDPRFVLTGVADADACFCIAALAGLLPHPAKQVAESLPPPVKAAKLKDLTALAETVGQVDVNPIGLNIPAMAGGDLLLTWNAMSSGEVGRTSLGAYAGVGLWVSLVSAHPGQIGPFLAAAKEAEANRRQASLDDLERLQEVNGVSLIAGSRVFGFPEWYGRKLDHPATDPRGWERPVVLAWLEASANITIGCPNTEVAETIFGPGGLKNAFAHLSPEGWGGREAVGGSPRGVKLSLEQAQEAARSIGNLILEVDNA